MNLNPRQPLAIKFGLGVYALIYICVGFLLLSMIIGSDTSRSANVIWLIAITFLLLYTLFCFLLARSFIRKLTQEETICVNATHITIIDKSLFGKKERRFDLKFVKQISVAQAEDFTPHPMEDNNAAINFAVNERLIRYQISDGNMMIAAGKIQHRFGKNIPSWDAEEMILEIERYTGRSFTPVHTIAEPVIDQKKYRGEM